MNRAFWVVWNENSHALTAKHDTFKSAESEAERLARGNPGSRFFVLKAQGYVERSDLHHVWFDDTDDGIPF